MSVYSGTNIDDSGLLVSFDAANFKSFRGEPTTNLIPSPTVNAYPTTGNGWGTYNTNQYGSGAYFSIGTVASVSDNIVTMTAPHSLRSYDVMQPQTTGGGVTAGTNYLIKKLSSTTFSLHPYNSSQDGSQGYINPSTGTHKVYDDFANNVKVSINATNFPTMWWGYPHLPNSGLVKELRYKEFTALSDEIGATDCIRLHYIRTDDVKDGMAYGVDCSISTASPVTVSFYTRAVTASAEGKSIQYYIYNYGASATAYAWNFTLGPPGVWQRQSFTFTPAYGTMISYWFPQSGGVYSWDWACMQVEQKSAATTFTTGTRGTTSSTGGGWIDMTLNKNNGELFNGPTYDSSNSGSIVFDGTNDYIDVSSSFGTLSNYTIMFWAYRSAENRMPIAGRTSTAFYWYGDNSWYYTHGGVAGEYYYSKPTSIPLNTWGFYCVVYNGSNVSIYRQGIYQGQQSTTGTADWSQGLKIGYWSAGGNYAWQGKISNVQMYNRALSANEIKQTFNAMRMRYGL